MSIANVIQSPETKLAISKLTAAYDGAIAAVRGLNIEGDVVEAFIKTSLVPAYAKRVDDIKSGSVNLDAPIEAVVKKTRTKRNKEEEKASTDPGDTGVQKATTGKGPKKVPGADMM